MEISPKKSEAMALLGQDAATYKIIVQNKCLQQVKNFKYLGCKIPYQNEKDIQRKLEKCSQIHGTLKHRFYQFWSQNFQEANWLSPFLYMTAKFGLLE
jgi:hypothetical protein